MVLLTRERGKLRAVAARGARGAQPRYQSALEPLSRGAGHALRPTGGRAAPPRGMRAAALGVPRGDARARDRAGRCRTSPSCSTPSRRRARRRTRCTGWRIAVVRAAEEGRRPRLLARYLEAWLLRLHGLYPPLDRCAGCGGALPAGELRYHAPAHGFVCDALRPRHGPGAAAAGARARCGDSSAGRRPVASPAACRRRARSSRFHHDADLAPPRARPALVSRAARVARGRPSR